RSASRGAWAAAAMLVAATVLTYGRGLPNGFVYVDHWLVEANTELRHPGSLAHFLGTSLFAGVKSPDNAESLGSATRNWRPFVKLALLCEFRAFGTNPIGYHAVSLAVHAGTVLLLFMWLYKRLEQRQSNAVLPAALGAAWFAL